MHTHTSICSFRGICTCMQVNKNTYAIQLHSAYTHTQQVFVFKISLKSLHIPKLTPACPTDSHTPLHSTYVQALTCTQMVHMCNYPTTHIHTHTHVHSLACPGNEQIHIQAHTMQFLCAYPEFTYGRLPCIGLVSAPSHFIM